MLLSHGVVCNCIICSCGCWFKVPEFFLSGVLFEREVEAGVGFGWTEIFNILLPLSFELKLPISTLNWWDPSCSSRGLSALSACLFSERLMPCHPVSMPSDWTCHARRQRTRIQRWRFWWASTWCRHHRSSKIIQVFTFTNTSSLYVQCRVQSRPQGCYTACHGIHSVYESTSEHGVSALFTPSKCGYTVANEWDC